MSDLLLDVKERTLKCCYSCWSIFHLLVLCPSPSFPLFQIAAELVGNTVLNCRYSLVHIQLHAEKQNHSEGGVVLI